MSIFLAWVKRWVHHALYEWSDECMLSTSGEMTTCLVKAQGLVHALYDWGNE